MEKILFIEDEAALQKTFGDILGAEGFQVISAIDGEIGLRLAESEKERFVTYYFNGMREERFNGEDVQIVPSPKVATYDKKPEMSVFGVVEEFKKALSRGVYHFFVINF